LAHNDYFIEKFHPGMVIVQEREDHPMLITLGTIRNGEFSLLLLPEICAEKILGSFRI
jgi:hypothetical protein